MIFTRGEMQGSFTREIAGVYVCPSPYEFPDDFRIAIHGGIEQRGTTFPIDHVASSAVGKEPLDLVEPVFRYGEMDEVVVVKGRSFTSLVRLLLTPLVGDGILRVKEFRGRHVGIELN